MPSTFETIASASEPEAAMVEAASVTSPNDIDTTCESMTCTRLASVISAPCRADSYVPLSFSEMWIETTESWLASSDVKVSANWPGDGCDVVGCVVAFGSLR